MNPAMDILWHRSLRRTLQGSEYFSAFYSQRSFMDILPAGNKSAT